MAQVQQVSVLTQDHLGSPRVITNEAGAVTSRQDFSAFGDETLTVQRTQGLGYKPDELRKDYTGYEKDGYLTRFGMEKRNDDQNDRNLPGFCWDLRSLV